MSDLRIGTWNVEYARGELKNRARREHLVTQMADVWILTETHDNSTSRAATSRSILSSGTRSLVDGGRRFGHRCRLFNAS